jgi:dCTP deaminase
VLFPELAGSPRPQRAHGILASQGIRSFISDGYLVSQIAVTEEQIQPASLDLRLGPIAFRVQASFLPGPNESVMQKVKNLEMAQLDLREGAVLERGCVYIVPLLEELHLPRDVYGKANPRSSTGRLDLFTRLICDRGTEFEMVPGGYSGPLYAEVAPRTFSVRVRQGTRLNQLRFVRGKAQSADRVLTALAREEVIVYNEEGAPARPRIDRGLKLSIDLAGDGSDGLVAYRARPHTPVIDLGRTAHYELSEFWEPIRRVSGGWIILNPGEFYILASKERVSVPPDYAAELVAYDPAMGEFRVHYAGFFDPGFGYDIQQQMGTRAVLEVRAHEVPFLVEDGQVAGRLVYMELMERPDKTYGSGIGSAYQWQGLSVSRHFRMDERESTIAGGTLGESGRKGSPAIRL